MSSTSPSPSPLRVPSPANTMLQFPSTPQSNQFLSTHKPRQSSPLASPASSPISEGPSHRRAQYKSRTPSTPRASFSFAQARMPVTPTPRRVSGPPATAPPLLRAQGSSPPEPPQTTFLRQRFRARCAEHSARARARGVSERRWGKANMMEVSSDAEMEMDDDEDDDDVMADELFRRIMANHKHKRKHNFRLSYAEDVGSSIDPSMEDVDRWERDLQTVNAMEPVPEEVDEEELQAYAAEVEAQNLAAELEEYADQIFDLSEDELDHQTGQIEMDMA